MELWLILFIINRVLASLCPFTTRIGTVISTLTFAATIVFIGMTFFFAPRWWYGLISLGLFFIVPHFLPRINPHELGDTGRLLSGIGSIANDIIVVLMYLALFHVI